MLCINIIVKRKIRRYAIKINRLKVDFLNFEPKFIFSCFKFRLE